ncbi:MAG: TlpA family protein disulfide reductase [Candidatus Zixiibacteriota bacterium]
MKIPPLLICIPLLLASAACQKENSPPPAQTSAPVSGLEVKSRLGEGMEFPRVTVADHLGNRYELRALLSKSRNILLLLDASCPACAEESKKIQKFTARGSGLNIIGISKDSLPAVLTFKKRHGLFFPILLDVEQKLVPDYRRVIFPTLVLVGSDKKIARLYEGGIPPAETGPFLRLLLGN